MRSYGSGSFRKVGPGKYQLRFGHKSKTISDLPSNKAADHELKKWIARLQATEEQGDAITMNMLFDDHLTDLKLNGRTSYLITSQRIERHLRCTLGRLDARVIGHREINAYKQARLSEGAKPATVNNELSVVRRSLSLAREELQRVVKIEKLPTHNKRTGTVSEEAYRFLVKVLPDWAQGPFIFSYFTGVRQGELLELRWSWYDADSDTIVIPEGVSKNKAAGYLPLIADMKPALAMCLARRDPRCPFIFQRDGKQISKGTYRYYWDEARNTYKSHLIASGASVEEVKHILFHDCRRTAVTNMVLQAGLDLKEATAVSRHRTLSVAADYLQLQQQRTAEKVRERMNQVFSQKKSWRNLGGPQEGEEAPEQNSNAPKFKQ